MRDRDVENFYAGWHGYHALINANGCPFKTGTHEQKVWLNGYNAAAKGLPIDSWETED
jgi:ribosome modulation factor